MADEASQVPDSAIEKTPGVSLKKLQQLATLFAKVKAGVETTVNGLKHKQQPPLKTLLDIDKGILKAIVALDQLDQDEALRSKTLVDRALKTTSELQSGAHSKETASKSVHTLHKLHKKLLAAMVEADRNGVLSSTAMVDLALEAMEQLKPDPPDGVPAEGAVPPGQFRKLEKAFRSLEESEFPGPFNPLDYRVIGDSIAAEVESLPLRHVPPDRFPGEGVYALYYCPCDESLAFEPYILLIDKNKSESKRKGGVLFRFPIYVGKAIPPGARTGEDRKETNAIFSRLVKHAESIRQVESGSTLRLSDFRCRYLRVEPAFVHLSESTLIRKYKPLWNNFLSGFGSNPQGKGRKDGRKSLWDTFHPGRLRATKLGDAWDEDELRKAVKLWLSGREKEIDRKLLELASTEREKELEDEVDESNSEA